MQSNSKPISLTSSLGADNSRFDRMESGGHPSVRVGKEVQTDLLIPLGRLVMPHPFPILSAEIGSSNGPRILLTTPSTIGGSKLAEKTLVPLRSQVINEGVHRRIGRPCLRWNTESLHLRDPFPHREGGPLFASVGGHRGLALGFRAGRDGQGGPIVRGTHSRFFFRPSGERRIFYSN